MGNEFRDQLKDILNSVLDHGDTEAFGDGCLTNEEIVKHVRLNKEDKLEQESDRVREHLEGCQACRDLLDILEHPPANYERKKKEFVDAGSRVRPPVGEVLGYVFKPVVVPIQSHKLAFSLAAIAALVLVLGITPSSLRRLVPGRETNEAKNALHTISVTPATEPDTTTRAVQILKVATMAGSTPDPNQLNQVRTSVQQKAQLVGEDTELGKKWLWTDQELKGLEFLGRYQRLLSSSRSPAARAENLTLALNGVNGRTITVNASSDITSKHQAVAWMERSARETGSIDDILVSSPDGTVKQVKVENVPAADTGRPQR